MRKPKLRPGGPDRRSEYWLSRQRSREGFVKKLDLKFQTAVLCNRGFTIETYIWPPENSGAKRAHQILILVWPNGDWHTAIDDACNRVDEAEAALRRMALAADRETLSKAWTGRENEI